MGACEDLCQRNNLPSCEIDSSTSYYSDALLREDTWVRPRSTYERRVCAHCWPYVHSYFFTVSLWVPDRSSSKVVSGSNPRPLPMI
jgi:hypothetical protein